MKPISRFLLVVLAFSSPTRAQREPDVLLMREDEKRVIQKQAVEFADAIRPVARQASQSTLWVYVEGKKLPVALATVVGDGTRALTKWSEIALGSERAYVYGGNGISARIQVIGVYPDHDLALVQLDGASYRPIEWNTEVELEVGRFVVAAAPNDEPIGLGVVSVAARSLREKAYLGVFIDSSAYEGPGVYLERVEPRSAARAAGLRRGDILLSIDGKILSGAEDVRQATAGRVPGDRVKIRYRRNGEEAEVEVELKRAAEFPGFENHRLRFQEAMGGPVNLVRTNFPLAVQTDVKLKHNECGGPIVNLDGKVVGISVARADRTHALFIPSGEVIRLLQADPVAPDQLPDSRGSSPQMASHDDEEGEGSRQRRPQVVPLERGSADRLRRHLEDMERLMDIMRREMESIGE